MGMNTRVAVGVDIGAVVVAAHIPMPKTCHFAMGAAVVVLAAVSLLF